MADQLAASTNCYHPYSLEEALAGIAGAGFSSVELNSVPGWTEHVRRDAGLEEIGYVKDLLDKYSLTALSLSGHSDLTSDVGVGEFRKALAICKRLGITMITTSSGGHDASSVGELDEQRARFLERIALLCDEAAGLGITICLETHGGLLGTGKLASEIIKTVGKPNLGINYDAANVIYYTGADPVEDIKFAAPYVVHVHVKDQIGGKGVWNFPAVGTGEIDYPAIFATLDASGFHGPCSIEVEFQGEPWPPVPVVNEALETSYEYVRRLVPKE